MMRRLAWKKALKSSPEDILEQYESRLPELREDYGEAMLELKFHTPSVAFTVRHQGTGHALEADKQA
ncbi:hypothetical protein [uncultured Marinobacter sp.]|uniref:hypothetical protein n=1 Tax=uncultured Marinobacter sp. TaxID=187379 RepID=UPI0032B2071E|tara:strand:+ start:2785 stop:2985 length:201 start_codon:yes stop_codon:yes gene_type:complete